MPQARADAVFDLETALAKPQWPAADRRDAEKTYNPMTHRGAGSRRTGLSLARVFEGAGHFHHGSDR